MSFLEVFQYTRQDSVIHRLDPRSKFVFSGTCAAISLMFLQIVPLTILLFALIPLLAVAKSLGRWMRSMRGLLGLILFIMVFNTLFATVPHPLSYSIALTLRLIALMTSFSLFFLTVHPDDLSQALIQLHVKFEFAFAMSMAMRYVPTLAQEAYAIMDAQKARGVELDKGNLLRRIKNVIPIIVPLIVVSIRRALSVAESMESRGFGASENRTYLERLQFRRGDWAVVLVSLLLLASAVYIRYWLGLPAWMMWELPL